MLKSFESHCELEEVRIVSVSYTHLDVYKRQDTDDYTYEALKLFLLGAISRAFKPGCKFEVMPVSYTHLDVYKRQVLNRTPQANQIGKK